MNTNWLLTWKAFKGLPILEIVFPNYVDSYRDDMNKAVTSTDKAAMKIFHNKQ